MLDRTILTAEQVQGSRPRPGEYLCRACGFLLQARTLDPVTTATGTDARLRREECRNGHGLMDQRTEVDVIVSLDDNIEAQLDRRDAKAEAVRGLVAQWERPRDAGNCDKGPYDCAQELREAFGLKD